MPRKPIIRSSEHFYHITARSNNKENFHIEIENVWEIMLRNLRQLQLEFRLEIAAFVLMNNHFHLLMLTPNEDVDRVMYFFMKNVTRAIQKQSGRINKIFGGRYKGCLIDNDKYLRNAYKYVYRNPVAAGICPKAELYPFSTLNFTNGKISKVKVEVLGEFLFPEELYLWINQEFTGSEAERIKSGLTKTLFKLKELR